MEVYSTAEGRRRREGRHRDQTPGERLVDVTDVLRDRTQRAGRARSDGRRCRCALHARARGGSAPRAGALARLPPSKAPKSVMTISLGGGGDGPEYGGMTPIGGRAGADDRRRAPSAGSRSARRPRGAGDDRADADQQGRDAGQVDPAPRRAGAGRGARPDADAWRRSTRRQRHRRNRRARPGIRAVDRRRRRARDRRSTSRDFCCPDYLVADDRAESGATGTSAWKWRASSMVKFTIQRDGTMTDVDRRSTSGYLVLDHERAARRDGHAAAAAAAARRSPTRR